MTGTLLLFLACGGGVLLTIWGVYLRRVRRRREWKRRPFPASWRTHLSNGWPVYSRLPEEVRDRLHGLMRVFLEEKSFEGCGGLEVTEKMRVVVAAQACLLLAGRDPDRVYPGLKSVLLYPHTYVAGGKGIFGGQWDEPSARLGESWQTGAVILSWQSVRGGARNIRDGHNVTLHEFAHQLDQADGRADGAPELDSPLAARTWATCFRKEFDSFLKQLDKGRRTVIDEYGATNEAEFFSTATEAFFEKARQLERERPELYDELRVYYRLDPATW